jgi:hypothetical protein
VRVGSNGRVENLGRQTSLPDPSCAGDDHARRGVEHDLVAEDQFLVATDERPAFTNHVLHALANIDSAAHDLDRPENPYVHFGTVSLALSAG